MYWEKVLCLLILSSPQCFGFAHRYATKIKRLFCYIEVLPAHMTNGYRSMLSYDYPLENPSIVDV